MLDFNNTEIAFSAKSQSELKNAYLLFNTIKYPWLVKCASVASNIALNIHFPLGWAVKPTLYKQFVGGETLQDCTKAIDHLRKFNVHSTLDYSAEGEQTPEGIQATFEETMRSIDFAKGNDNLAYAVFKPSTIIADELLAKASEKHEELTIEEVKAYREFRERFMAFCQRAYDNDVRLIVDAEDYCFQDALDALTDEAMRRYNKKRAIVFATLQMYRHDRMPYLRRILDDAKEKGYAETLYGRRRPVPELFSSNFMQRSFGERVAMNSPIQGTAADIIKIAMIRVFERLKKEGLKSKLILQVHDELLIETALEEEEQVRMILEEEMVHASSLAVELEIDLHVGINWYEAK